VILTKIIGPLKHGRTPRYPTVVTGLKKKHTCSSNRPVERVYRQKLEVIKESGRVLVIPVPKKEKYIHFVQRIATDREERQGAPH
jgi:hypothetical protein